MTIRVIKQAKKYRAKAKKAYGEYKESRAKARVKQIDRLKQQKAIEKERLEVAKLRSQRQKLIPKQDFSFGAGLLYAAPKTTTKKTTKKHKNHKNHKNKRKPKRR